MHHHPNQIPPYTTNLPPPSKTQHLSFVHCWKLLCVSSVKLIDSILVSYRFRFEILFTDIGCVYSMLFFSVFGFEFILHKNDVAILFLFFSSFIADITFQDAFVEFRCIYIFVTIILLYLLHFNFRS